MKIKSVFLFSCLTVALGLGAFAGASATKPVEKAEASYAEKDTTYYYNVSNVTYWHDGAIVRIWLNTANDSSPDKWIDPDHVDGNIYSFNWEAHYGKAVICRFNPSKTDWTNWNDLYNQTTDIYFETYNNFITINNNDGHKNHNDSYVTKFAKDSFFYASFEKDHYDWFEGNGQTSTLVLLNDANGTRKLVNAKRRIGTSYTIEFEIDSDFYAQKAVVVRHGGSFNPDNWDATRWNQSPDIVFNSSNTSNRATLIKTIDGTVAETIGLEDISDNYFAKSFSYYFLAATAGYCNNSSIDVSTIAGNWTAICALGTTVDYNFYSAPIVRGKDVTYDSIVSNALSRYANMQEEKEYTDFLSLGDHNPKSKLNNIVVAASLDNNSNVLLIITIITLLTVISFASFIILKKKKEI